MAEKIEEVGELTIVRPERAKLSADEVRKRMDEFEKRKEKFIATVRKDKDRGVSS